jgi:hypothetical protein
VSDAIMLHYAQWRKKKVDGYIIPPQFFNTDKTAVENTPNKDKNEIKSPDHIVVNEAIIVKEEKKTNDLSSFSLASLKAKREHLQNFVAGKIPEIDLPKEPFTETEMLLQGTKIAQKLGDKGKRILESLMLINDPKLEGTLIIHHLPNESSKFEFNREKYDILGYLRGKLHNHDIDIHIVVDENIEIKKSFTPLDKFNRLAAINPALHNLKNIFDLEV